MFLLQLQVHPQTHTIYVMARKAALLPCNFLGFPRPSVYWTVTHLSTSVNVTNGAPRFLNVVTDVRTFQQKLTVYQNGTLHISEVHPTDSSGQFQCTAFNRLGLAKGAVILTLFRGRSGSATVSFITSLINPPSLPPFVRPCVRACVRLFVRSLVCSFVCSFFRSFIHSSIRRSIHPSIRPVN